MSKRTSLVLVMLTLSASAAAQVGVEAQNQNKDYSGFEGWRSFAWGTSSKRIKAEVGAYEMDLCDIEGTSEFVGQDCISLYVNGFEVDGRAWVLSFHFEKGGKGLKKVELERSEDPKGALTPYREIKATLSLKYGPGKEENFDDKGAGCRNVHARWSKRQRTALHEWYAHEKGTVYTIKGPNGATVALTLAEDPKCSKVPKPIQALWEGSRKSKLTIAYEAPAPKTGF